MIIAILLALLIKTGAITTAHRAGDPRYLSALYAREVRGFEPITNIDGMIGQPWRIFYPGVDEKMIQREPEIIGWDNGIAIHSGIISPNYAALIKGEMAQGKDFFVYKYVGLKAPASESPFHLQFPLGDVRPLMHGAKVRALELGWNEQLSLTEKLRICGKLIRDALRGQPLRRQAIKTASGARKAGQTIAAHNLVFCPNPTVLRDIQARKLPVDLMMEVAARRALEQYERKKGVKLTAICATHLEDSTGFRPHLHIRLVAYDSTGKYVPIFDRACGQAGGNRCVFEEEMQRQFQREIDRERTIERISYERNR
jgi:hypothetical protein